MMNFKNVRLKLENKETSFENLVKQYLDKIEKGVQLNAFIFVDKEAALIKAAEIDKKLENGTAGKLAGLVLAVKDNMAIKDSQVTCGSKILENFVSPYNATAIEKLLAEDALIIGKTNMDEFAMGSSNENSYFGPVKNPVDNSRVPGGSSGGSCTAVAAEMAMAALGSDTGGSIRQPASFCGVVGLKPTYGRVSRYGLVAFASSFDQIGPITNTVYDAAILLEVIAGHDKRDSTSAPVTVPKFSKALDGNIKGLKIGLPKEYFSEGLDSEIRESIENTIKILEENGAEILEVSLPNTEYGIAAYYILTTAEASSNLSRYDGARYGYRAENIESLEDMYVKSRSEGFGNEVKRRIMLGTYVLSSGYYDAYYRKGQQVRTLIKNDFEEAFKQCDCLITPTTPSTAFKMDEKTDDPLAMYLSDVYTVSVNLAGLPGMSLPCGFDSNNLPIGVQIIGKQFDEEMILRVGDFLEKNLALKTTG